MDGKKKKRSSPPPPFARRRKLPWESGVGGREREWIPGTIYPEEEEEGNLIHLGREKEGKGRADH